jgi:hypothetical protein
MAAAARRDTAKKVRLRKRNLIDVWQISVRVFETRRHL